ncbi:MAG: GntR family transcriptional regulator [Armatimonadetes bacterium]|nr:GntR family transcriptional regulator [Armatimonadota bacterium]MBS1712135.1 GntR family transcriptional regulator [Armatimonadota bacterium]MBX3107842.1 GntR family transcriptional regulator [Fimbriimonadaceae bacterium]
MPSGEHKPSARRNAFKEIASDLQSRIRSGEIGLGRMLPTERELQNRYGVSRSTVRRALSKVIHDGWAKNLPNRGVVAASGFTEAATKNIAFIEGQSYVQRVLSVRMSEALRAQGYHLIHLDATGPVALEDAIEYCVENQFAGAVVWPMRGFADDETMVRLSNAIPLVFLGHILAGAKADYVTFDNLNAGELATQRLIDSGCKRIAVTGMMDMCGLNHDRFSGYLKAMFANHFQPTARDFCFNYTSAMPKPDNTHLTSRLVANDRPDGIVVLQDEFVPSTIETALNVGLRVPEDVKICTIGDDVDVSVDGVGMSAVALDWDEVGQRAIELLMDRIANPTRDVKTAVSSHRLIVRGLCGAHRSEWTENPDALSGFHGNVPFPRSEYRFSSSWPTALQVVAPELKEEAPSS